MVADTNSPLLRLLLMGTGNDNNAWGTNANNSVFLPLETAIADAVSVATTGGTLTLSAGQALYATLVLTGNLAADLVIVVPDTNKVYRIINKTVGGGFFTRLKCSTAATVVNVPAGSKMTTVVAVGGIPIRQDGQEVGRYVHDAASVTGDVVECDGSAFKRASLPDLFAKISTTYGNNDGTDFKVPNAYATGKFLRSRTASFAVGTLQSNQNLTHTHTSGTVTTSGASATHTHTVTATTSGASATHTHSGTTDSSASLNHTHTFSGTTGAMSANASHTHTTTNLSGATVLTTGGGGEAYAGGGTSHIALTSGFSIDSKNTDHTHTFSGSTGATDLTHTHTFTTGVNSADHTHQFSVASGNNSADHTHTFSFTTSAGSADGTEARPEALVTILCIRY